MNIFLFASISCFIFLLHVSRKSFIVMNSIFVKILKKNHWMFIFAIYRMYSQKETQTKKVMKGINNAICFLFLVSISVAVKNEINGLFSNAHGITGAGHTTNEEIFRRIPIINKPLLTIKERQLTFWVHLMKKFGLEKLILTGYIEFFRSRGK